MSIMATIGWMAAGAVLGLAALVVGDFVISEFFDRALY
jgi:hypothetical protein